MIKRYREYTIKLIEFCDFVEYQNASKGERIAIDFINKVLST